MGAHARIGKLAATLGALMLVGPISAVGQDRPPEIDPVPTLHLGSGAGGPGDQLGLVVAAARTLDGGLVVLDGMVAALKVYDARGLHIRDIGGRGDGPGEFRDPSALVALGDTLVVLDQTGRRTFVSPEGVVFATDRLVIEPLCGDAFNARYGGLLADATVLVRCEERLFGRVRGEYRQRVQLLRLGRLGTVDSLGVFPADTGRADSGGVPVPRPYTPRSLLLWAAAGQRLFVATSDSPTVLVQSYSGERETALRLPLADRPTTAEDFDEAVALSLRLTGSENDRRVVREWTSQAPRAERTPFLRSLVAASSDEVWVGSWQKTGERSWWLVANDRGKHERVLAPPNSELLAVGTDWTLWRWRDSFAVEYVRLHRLER